MMEILEGRAISRGIAIGTLFFYSRNAKQEMCIRDSPRMIEWRERVFHKNAKKEAQ